MKKTVFYLMMTAMLLSAFPSNVMASEKNPMHSAPVTKEVPAEVKVLLDRIYEIKEMDKSKLSRAERKALRKEVRAIKAKVRSFNGLFISSGAIIIILLLIIIL